MQFGYADAYITPAPGEELTGYGYYLNRRATGTQDPLMARAVAMSDGAARAVVVQLDLLALSREFTAEVRAEVQRRTGLPGECLMLHCTHTHSGPAARITFACGRPSEHFLHDLRNHILTVAETALNDLKPAARMEWFEQDFPQGFAHNRVGGTDLDTMVRGVRVEVQGARPIVIVNYACHPVTMGANREYSADYPGAVLRELNAYGTRAVFLTGPSGDINPLSNAYRGGSGNLGTLMIYGRDLAQVVREGLGRASEWQAGRVAGASEFIALDINMPPAEALAEELVALREQLLEQPDNGHLRMDAEWHELMLQRYAADEILDASRAEIQGIACGDVTLVGLSAETFTGMGTIIREQNPGRKLLLANTCNGVIGYISDRRDVEMQGYAAYVAAKLYGMPLPAAGAGEKWAEAGAKLVAGLG